MRKNFATSNPLSQNKARESMTQSGARLHSPWDTIISKTSFRPCAELKSEIGMYIYNNQVMLQKRPLLSITDPISGVMISLR